MNEFKTPKHCTANRDRQIWKQPYGFKNKAKGERYQFQCAACGRWCYMADRCKLFVAVAPRKRGPVTENELR